jgi:hypothetical protein
MRLTINCKQLTNINTNRNKMVCHHICYMMQVDRNLLHLANKKIAVNFSQFCFRTLQQS